MSELQPTLYMKNPEFDGYFAEVDHLVGDEVLVEVEFIGTIRLHKGRNSMSVDLPPTTSNGTYAIVRVLPEADK